MALTPTEEAQTRQLIAQEAPLLSLAGNEPTITSKLGATKVNLSQLPAASTLADADIMLVRQGTTDKSVPGSVLKTYASAGSVQKSGDIMTGALIGLGATSGNQVPNFSQIVGPVGGSPNIVAIVGAVATASLAFADEQVIVGTAAGLRYAMSAFSQAINLATTGAGGMDVGTAPANGYVAVYAIQNTANGARNVLAQNITATAASAIYSGANMPAGYTASGLIAILPTNASGVFPAYVSQQGRMVSAPSITVLTGGGPSAGYTAISLAPAAPRGSKSVSGNAQVTVSTGGNSVVIAANAGGSGGNIFAPFAAGQQTAPFRSSTPETQRIYYTATVNVANVNVFITGYEF